MLMFRNLFKSVQEFESRESKDVLRFYNFLCM